jgi:hypothetical protein
MADYWRCLIVAVGVGVIMIAIWKEHIPITIWAGWTGEIEHPALGVDFGCPTASAAGLLSLGT